MATKKKSAKAAGKTPRVESKSAIKNEVKSEAKPRSAAGHEITIAPANGKLGGMIPGMGAVATTFVAGVEAIRKGLAKPIGSLTQMGTVRLGERGEGGSDERLLDQLKPFLSTVTPRAAVFDHNYVKKIDGPNVKKGKTKMDLA